MKSLKSYYFPVVMMLMLFLCNISFGQTVPDSLLRKLDQATNDSIKARTILDIGEAIEATATEKSIGYYQQALVLSKKINNNHLILSSFNDIGICYIELNKMDSAIISFELAIPFAKQM